jgi:hypothetical protein
MAIMVTPPPDPILERRARLARLAATGQRLGYGLLGVSIAAFVVAVATGLPSLAVRTVEVSLVLACVVLPPAIVLGFAVRAADRDDRDAER